MPVLSTSAKVSIASNIAALCAVGLAWWGWPTTAPLPYSVHKLLHIVGVVIFMGNLVAGPVWIALAFSEREPGRLAFAARALALADVALTAPGVQLTAWNGVCLAASMGGAARNPWLVEALLLLVGTSLFSCTVVLYWQERFIELAQRDAGPGTLRALIHWGIWGTAVSIPFGLIGWLMVSKQPLWLGP